MERTRRLHIRRAHPGQSAGPQQRPDQILYPAIERANGQPISEDRPPFPDGVTFHSLGRTCAALRAELGEHLAVTPAQMGYREPRVTLRVYTDVTGMKSLRG